MRMTKRRNSRRVGFEKCPIPWKELINIISLVNDVFSTLKIFLNSVYNFHENAFRVMC